jgi:hypothetical protein
VNPTSRSPNSNLLTAHPWKKNYNKCIASSTGRRLTTRRTSTDESHRSSEHENEP